MMVRITTQQMELLHYNDIDVRQYFWQTTQQQEIDFIEESHDQWATGKTTVLIPLRPFMLDPL